MSHVFIVQDQKWKNGNGELKSKFDFSAARKYGELVDLLPPNASPFNPGPAIATIRDVFQRFNYGDDCHIILVGNPCLIGFAVAIAAELNDGRVSLLQWSGTRRDYLEVRCALW